MRPLAVISAILFAYFFYGLYINQFELAVYPESYSRQINTPYNDYRGVLDVHSENSFGSGTVNFINLSAKTAGLDFLFINDYNLMGPWTYSDSYRNGILQFVAPKFSYTDSRIIQYDFGRNQYQQLADAQLRLTDSLSQQSPENHEDLLILSRSTESDFKWKGDFPSGLDGLEIINLKSQLKKAWANNPASLFWSLLIYPFNPRLAFIRIFSEPTDEFSYFDQIATHRKLVAVIGAEASAKAIPFSNALLKFPSYLRVFEMASNHVLLQSELTGSFISDRQKIIAAIKGGNLYFSFDLLGNPKGFYAEAVQGIKKYVIGSSLKYQKGTKISYSLPQKPNCFFEIILLRNGEGKQILNEKEGSFEISEPGVYRLQVRVSPTLPLPDAKRWLSWIYTNPIYISP